MKLRASTAMLGIIFLASALRVWSAPASNDAAAFAQLKSLAGDWESPADKGGKSHLRYEVVSGGSAVVEHFVSDEMGASNAMVTVYYLDGDHLQLTHYCMARSQPHMQAEAFDSSTGELRFAFVNATGLSSPGAGHMHNATFRFIDADHFSTDWQFFENGKPKFNEAVQYTRVR
jgi:hypothetical protein